MVHLKLVVNPIELVHDVNFELHSAISSVHLAEGCRLPEGSFELVLKDCQPYRVWIAAVSGDLVDTVATFSGLVNSPTFEAELGSLTDPNGIAVSGTWRHALDVLRTAFGVEDFEDLFVDCNRLVRMHSAFDVEASGGGGSEGLCL